MMIDHGCDLLSVSTPRDLHFAFSDNSEPVFKTKKVAYLMRENGNLFLRLSFNVSRFSVVDA